MDTLHSEDWIYGSVEFEIICLEYLLRMNQNNLISNHDKSICGKGMVYTKVFMILV
jgi:hypothetical protein